MTATYLDSSAIVKLVLAEAETPALQRYLRRRQPLVSSALARTEVRRAALVNGERVLARADEILKALEFVRVNDRVLRAAGTLPPMSIRSLDAIHLATALQLGPDLGRVVSYDDRLLDAARANGLRTAQPA
jgi:predicted nucleic acid-binding protein